ncbi:LCP family protein [Streptomyces sp. NPDC051322]|uniref:LCP family protein n=1 Tax=Streptomyces sp. NPDC051322 TaxID=3154645 RepID=UPI00344B3049
MSDFFGSPSSPPPSSSPPASPTSSKRWTVRGVRVSGRQLAATALTAVVALAVFEAVHTVSSPAPTAGHGGAPPGAAASVSGNSGPAAARGMNVLLVGLDARDGVTAQQKAAFHLGGAACHCTDTMMLVHVAENRRRVSVVSLPRDSLTRIPAYTDKKGKAHRSRTAKLNAAYAEGGAALTMRTVEQMTGLHIDRFLPVDFARFMKAVDGLGGLDVCTDRPLKDSATGLDLPAGTTRLSGGRALQYARSRHVDNQADFGRIQRQQKFVVSFVKEIADDGTLRSPARMAILASVLLPETTAVPTERAFTVKDMVLLARDLRNIGLDSLEFSTVPVKGFVTVKGVGSTVAWDAAKSAAVFRAVRADQSLTTATAAMPAGHRTVARRNEFVPVKGSELACP